MRSIPYGIAFNKNTPTIVMEEFTEDSQT